MTVSDQTVMPLAELLLGCLSEQISQVARPPKNVSLRPGDQIQLLMSKMRDECCEGLAWVLIVGEYPSSNFPDQDSGFTPGHIAYGQWGPCGTGQSAVTFQLGAARCAPIGTVTQLPTAAQWTDVTRAVLDDKAALRRAVCCFANLSQNEDRMYVLGPWQPLQVEGGCVGSTRTVTVAVPDCDCAEM